MTASINFKIYDLLNAQFQEPTRARAVTEAIEELMDQKVAEGTKNSEAFFHKDLELLSSRFDEKLTEKISEVKVDLIKWMVGIFITLALMIVGLYVKK